MFLRILASEVPLHISLGAAFPGPPVANICSPSCMSPLRKRQGRSRGAGASWSSATEACLHGKMEWLAGVFPAWRESRGKREKGRIPIASNLHLGRRKQASIKSLPKVLSEVPFRPPMPGSYLSSQDTLSFGVWKRQPPNPAKGQCWDRDGNRSPGFWPGPCHALLGLLEPLTGLSFSPASFPTGIL